MTKKSAQYRLTARATAKVAPVVVTRDDLARQLVEAQQRIVELEARLSRVTDRVAWIADRLHAVLNQED
jgi:hypothetical protein